MTSIYARLFRVLGAVTLCLTWACARKPTSEIRPQFTAKEAVADIPMHWISLPRPSPLPPLDHGALLVPVTFEGLSDKPLYMQFDMGHPTTVLYANKWADLVPRLRAVGQTFTTDGPTVQNLSFRVGALPVRAGRLVVLANQAPGIDWKGDGVEIIGTIGADLVAGRTLVMDFKGDRIQVAADRSLVARPGDVFTPFSIRWRRMLIPARVDGKATRIMYDSGSSAFALITSESAWTRMGRPGAIPTSFPVRSWKRTLTAHVVDTDATMQIGQVTLPIQQVSRMEGTSWWQGMAMRFFGMGGMAGNRLFLGHRLILDTARQEFCLSE
ncbi:hypothetical protein [Geothrix sp. PMB-07]|uniref:hypothetical protein n=1 Tax=Geothrix sp. PMB-07 TaxID=3068640 RepID=UPI0027427A8F|nr:hypothetical protein [Geothrix sp. PMB-07]WLT32255.1 hypothetical protein Q9293_02760 [Geothrix sp. PMB-07]